jgi:uncharacterized protein YdbL (DUF1318 family)
MNNRIFFAAVVSATVLISPAFANEAAAAKGRMRERVPAIDKLKLAGAVGENNRGFLEVREQAPNADEVVAAENADRETVFADTAKRTGSSVDAVGKAFARQLAAASAKGVWVQSENGKWSKK